MKIVFKDKARWYLLVSGLGVLAGLLVVLFCAVPDSRLWAFYAWSAETFGFWMFSASLLALLSEKRGAAAVNVAIYIFLMFFITTAYMSLSQYWRGETPYSSVPELVAGSAGGWLMYSVPPAALCGALGAVMWSGRGDTPWARLLRALPVPFILAEAAIMLHAVFTERTRLFSALTDLACLAGYIVTVKWARE